MNKTNTSKPGLTRLLRDREGSSLIEVALITPILLLTLAGAVDFGRAYYAAVEVTSAAESGALYGSLNNTDVPGMEAAAKLDAADIPSITATAIHGCECSDGTGVVADCTSTPSCTYNVVNYVEVDTAATYTPIVNWPGIGSSFALQGKARIRAGH